MAQTTESHMTLLQSVLSHSHDTLRDHLGQDGVDLKTHLITDPNTLEDEQLCSLLCALQCACACTDSTSGCCVTSAVNWKHRTLLHFAVLACNPTACDILLNHDPSCVDIPADDRYTALHLAAAMYSCAAGKRPSDNSQRLKQICHTLCERGSDVNARTSSGETVLHFAHVDLMDMLVESGCKLDAQKRYGYSKLMMCARFGDLAIMERLVALGCNVNLQNSCWTTALMLSVNSSQEQHPSAVKLLLEAGAEVDRVNNVGKTAAILAAENNCVKCIKLLLQHQPDLDLDRFDVEGQTALSILAATGNTEGVELILPFCRCLDFNRMSSTTPLWEAARAGHHHIVRLLVLARAGIDAACQTDTFTSTPVVAAVVGSHLETSRLLLRAGCDRRPLVTLLAAPPKSLQMTSSDLDLLRELCKRPPTLRDLTCGVIRRQLQTPVTTTTDDLPLPRVLRAEVLLQLYQNPPTVHARSQ